MTKLKLLLFASLLAAAPVMAACGDDDDDNPITPIDEAGTSETGPNPEGGPVPDGGPDGGPPSSFPAYVEQLITTKTSDTAAPDQEAVWGAIPDDEKFVFPATFF